MALFDDLSDGEREVFELIEKNKMVHKVYPKKRPKPGVEHWSDGTITRNEYDPIVHGCYPSPGLVPVRWGASTTIYTTPERAKKLEKKKKGLLSRLLGG